MKGRHIAMIANTSTTTNHCTIPRQKIATILTPCTKYKKTSTQNVAPQCRHKHTHTHAKPQKNDGWLRHMHSATLDGLKTINNDNLFTPTQWGRKSQHATTKVPPHTHTHTHARKNPPRNEQTEHTESLTHMLPHNKTIDDGPNTRHICQPTTRAMTKNCNMHRVFLKLHILSRLEHKPFSPLNFKTPFDF